MRIRGVAVLAAALVAVSPGTARAEELLEPADAEELVGLLADAAAEQDICYGWDVSVADGDTGRTFRDVGSNWGVGQAADEDERCPRYVVLAVDMEWAPETSEAEDSASAEVRTSVPGLDPDTAFNRLGVSSSDFVSDQDDVAVFRATAGLPALVADTGAAPPVTPQPDALAKPEADSLTGSPSSDFLRVYAAPVVLSVLALLGASAWLVYAFLGVTRNRPTPPARRTSRPTGGSATRPDPHPGG